MNPTFTRFEATGLTSLTPLLRGKGGDIYVLEFADGSQYLRHPDTLLRRSLAGGYQPRHWSAGTNSASTSAVFSRSTLPPTT